MNVIVGNRGLLMGLLVARREFYKLFSSAVGEETKRRITVPQRMVKVLERRHAKERLDQRFHQQRKKGQAIIICRRSQFNHHAGQTYSSFSPKELASGGWKHSKSKGDHFTITAVHGNPALLPLIEESGASAVTSFESLNLHEELLHGLKMQNVTKPTNIQALTIPLMQKGLNVICAAETGSGKTLAFLLPMIERVHRYRSLFGATQAPNRPIGVILTPSRELADQIHRVASELAAYTPFVADVKCGGRRTQKLLKEGLEAPVDILVTTPGVFSKLLTNKMYDLSRLSQIVLDEADTLLDDSFSQMTTRIIQKLKVSSEKPVLESPTEVRGGTEDYNSMQIALVGATMPRSVEDILGEVVAADTIHTVTTKHLHRIMPHVTQKFVRVGPSQRPEHFLTQMKTNFERKIPTIVFCNKTSATCFLGHLLDSSNIPNIVLHAKMTQKVREGRYEKFQNGECDILICTDIVSRGLDTIRARHVINYEFPNFISDYIHRVGRVGRVGTNGSSFVLSYICYKWDVDLLWQIETSARRKKEFHNVNANIKRKLVGLSEKKEQETAANVIEV